MTSTTNCRTYDNQNNDVISTTVSRNYNDGTDKSVRNDKLQKVMQVQSKAPMTANQPDRQQGQILTGY